jgi:hypothetical protein
MKIKQNEKPNIQICQMLCDKPLHPKLDKIEIFKFLNHHSLDGFIGKPHSGKTSLMYSLLCPKSKKDMNKSNTDQGKFFKVFEHIFLFQPSHSRASMKTDIFSKLDESEFPKKYDELTYENLQEVITNIKSLPEDEKSLIIFDDMTAYLNTDKNIITLLKDICMNRRHYHISIFFLVQTFKSLPKEIRRLLENLFIFKVSKETFDSIFEELLEDYNTIQIKKDLLKTVYTTA